MQQQVSSQWDLLSFHHRYSCVLILVCNWDLIVPYISSLYKKSSWMGHKLLHCLLALQGSVSLSVRHKTPGNGSKLGQKRLLKITRSVLRLAYFLRSPLRSFFSLRKHLDDTASFKGKWSVLVPVIRKFFFSASFSSGSTSTLPYSALNKLRRGGRCPQGVW